MTDFRSSFRHDEFWVLPPSWRISSHLFAMAGFGSSCYANELTKRGFKRVYHSCVGPLNVIKKALHIRVSKVSYNDIYAWRTTICFIGLVLPSKASSDER
ncbi:hypothetical protein GW17_00026722 [Ensete ventricosum]|nr:hypothetical protein GW17_00026722 [Ensete ventricosum]